jgi:hypothetical protein
MFSGAKAANKQAAAIAEESALKTSAKAKETTAVAAAQKVGFLSSGIGLTGEDNSTPMSVMSSTYAAGKADIDLIGKNYATQIQNVYSQARSKLIKQLGSTVLGIAGAGSGSLFGAAGSAGVNSSLADSGFTLGSLGDYGSYQSAGLVP